MATETFLIQFRQVGAEATTQSIRQIGAATTQTATVLRLFRQALVALSFIRAASGLVELVDAAVRVDNRLRVATTSSEQFARAQQFISEISQQTHTDLEANATVYGRLLRATEGAGFSATQLETAMSAVTAAVRVSGATSDEASNALVQLSQGLAAGAVRGQDLRSVVSFLPPIADAIGKSFGIAGGKLYAFANANPGIITTKVVVDALAKALPNLQARAALIKPTLDNAFTDVHTAIIQFIQNVNQATGFIGGMVSAVEFLAHNIGTIIPLLFTAGELWASVFLAEKITAGIEAVNAMRKAIIAATVSMEAFNAAARANIWGLIATGIALAVFALTQLFTYSETARNALGQLWSGFTELLGIIGQVATFIGSALLPIWTGMEQIAEALWPAIKAIAEALITMVKAAAPIVAVFNPLVALFIDAEGRGTLLANMVRVLAQGFALLITVGITPLVLAFGGLVLVLNSLGLVSDATMAKVRDSITDYLKLTFTNIQVANSAKIVTDATQKVGEAHQATKPPVDDLDAAYEKLHEGAVNNATSQTDLTGKLGKTGAAVRGQTKDVFSLIDAWYKESNAERAAGLGLETVNLGFRTLQAGQVGFLGFTKDAVSSTDSLHTSTDGLSTSMTGLGSAMDSTASASNSLEAALAREDALMNDSSASAQTLQDALAAVASTYDGLARSANASADAVGSATSSIAAAASTASSVSGGDRTTLGPESGVVTGGGGQNFYIPSGAVGHPELTQSFEDLLPFNDRLGIGDKGGIGGGDKGFSYIYGAGGGGGGSDHFGDYIKQWLATAYKNPNIGTLQDFLHILGVPGFATGGDFTVGGEGGPDSQLVAFKATPGEEVSVRNPRKKSGDNRDESAKPERPINIYFNVQTPDANSFRMTQRQTIQNLVTAVRTAESSR